MAKDFPRLEESVTQEDAKKYLLTQELNGAVVVDARGDALGFFPLSANISGPGCPVRDVMAPLFKISADATLEELGQALQISENHRLFVSSGENIVGLVSTSDLMKGIFGQTSPGFQTKSRRPAKTCLFETELESTSKRVCVKTSCGETIVVEPSYEFGGSEQTTSPEDLFVAAISSCLCLTYWEITAKANLEILSYKCRAIGRLEGDYTNLRFSRVDLYPKIQFRGSQERADHYLTQAKLRCLVGRSADVIVVLHPTFCPG